MEGILFNWVSNIIKEASKDDKVRENLKKLNFKKLNGPKELEKYSVDVSEGTNNGFEFKNNTLKITLSKKDRALNLNTSKSKKLNVFDLNSVAGGGTAYIGGISEENGVYSIKNTSTHLNPNGIQVMDKSPTNDFLATDSDKNDDFTLLKKSDGSYVIMISNTKTEP